MTETPDDTMDKGTRDLLEQIHAEMRAAGEQVQVPASAQALDTLRDYAARELHAALPQAYLDFLCEADGLDFNGTVIYATRQRALPGGLTLQGFPESNRAFRGVEPRHHIVFGETGDELYTLDQTTSAWLRLDRGSLSPLEAYPTCDAMLAEALRQAFER